MERHDDFTGNPDIPQGERPAGRPRGNRKRQITIVVVVSLLNMGLIALLWSQLTTPARNSGSGGTGIPAGGNALVGHAAPDFALTTLSENNASFVLHLSNFKGKPVVLNFWASWCGPCQDEAPFLRSAWQSVQGKGVVFVGVDDNDTVTDGNIFLHKYAVPYPNVIDANGAAAVNYGVTGNPETFFINRQGIVVAWVAGPLTSATFQSNLQKIMG